MLSILNASTVRSTIVVMFAVICVVPVLAQPPDGDIGMKPVADDQSLEQALRKLTSLNDQVREARRQQTDERVAAERAIAALEAENKELKREQYLIQRRIAALDVSARQGRGLSSPLEEMTRNVESLHRTVGKLQNILRTGESITVGDSRVLW